MIHFWFITLFKLVASSFQQKVADLYEQSSRRISWAIGGYWNPCFNFFQVLALSLVFCSVWTDVDVVEHKPLS